MLTVSMNDFIAERGQLAEEVNCAVKRVLDSGWYVQGSEVSAFEARFAQYCATAECVGVNSGTDALHLALRACGVGPGDEVITVSHTAVATVVAIRLTGATPVFVDILLSTYSMNPDAFEAAITSRTKVVIPVHLYGQAAEMSAIFDIARKHGIYIVEDCAQAHGALYEGEAVGTIGDLGCFSFYPTKNLGALGDAGAVVGSNKNLIEKVRLLREYGWMPTARYFSLLEGVNSRLDEIQAAILSAKLPYLDPWNRRRQEIARKYDEQLPTGLITPAIAENRNHVYHLYVVRVKSRTVFRQRLHERNIGTGIHYPTPVHLQSPYLRFASSPLPATEEIADEIVSLPVHPFLSDKDIDYVCEAIAEIRWEL